MWARRVRAAGGAAPRHTVWSQFSLSMTSKTVIMAQKSVSKLSCGLGMGWRPRRAAQGEAAEASMAP